jgi:hypothetical protein
VKTWGGSILARGLALGLWVGVKLMGWDYGGLSDRAQLAFATQQGRVLFTQDDDFLVLHQEGVEHCGIAYCHPRSHSIGEVVTGLALIWEVLEPEEMHNHIEFV